MKTVYLCGNIFGQKWDEATNWRNRVSKELNECGFEILDPMVRASKVDVLGFVNPGEEDEVDPDVLRQQQEFIFFSDIKDVMNSDVIFCFMTSPSIGSAFELGVAWCFPKKIVVIVTTPELIEHPFLATPAYFITTDIQSAIQFVKEKLS